MVYWPTASHLLHLLQELSNDLRGLYFNGMPKKFMKASTYYRVVFVFIAHIQ